MQIILFYQLLSADLNTISYFGGENMKLISTGTAGTLESGDIAIEIEKSGEPGVIVELDSTVKNLYGKQIEKVIRETAAEYGADGVRIIAEDKGALDCTIRARVTTALMRACKSENYKW